jgi:NADH dehydrogenase FAD-containing subunit
MSGFISNLVVTGLLPLEFITHSMSSAAAANGYNFLNAAVSDVDKESKVVYTNEGTVAYDYLVVSPGIDYDYSKMTGGDTDLEADIKRLYPSAFIPGNETLQLKDKVENFEGGNFVLTVPGGNYRCLPGPYERACLIADHIKKNEINGKVILLDTNPDITIKKDGFQAAFNELYKDTIEYLPSSEITKVDLGKKVVTTELGEEIDFAEAALYSRVRGAKILERMGIAKDSPFNKMEADINDITYEVNGAKDIWVGGDARPMPFSKSGNTANSEAKLIAKTIANKIDGKETSWVSPHTTCYSAVQGDPLQAISVNADYAKDAKGNWGFANASTNEKRSNANGKGLIEWGKGIYRDML